MKLKSLFKKILERNFKQALIESADVVAGKPIDCIKFISAEDKIVIAVNNNLEDYALVPFYDKPAFVFKDKLLDEEIKVLIPGGTEI